MTSRRAFLYGVAAGVTTAALPARAKETGAMVALTMPRLLDSRPLGQFDLAAMAGQTKFLGRATTSTWGFSQAYLGPTLRVAHRGETRAAVENTLEEEIAVHWHGLAVPGNVDGGPHQTVRPGDVWRPILPIDQPAATLWYHAHTHGETARHVYRGLAGVMQLWDGRDAERGLPSTYGVDDLTLVLQDRRFDQRGRMVYSPSMRDRRMGFTGDVMLVNGQLNRVALVPKGFVRLRLLNGSNARIYALSMDDGRELHLVATDGGLLDRPVALKRLLLAPGERAEVLVDFTNERDCALVTSPISGMFNGRHGMKAHGMKAHGMKGHRKPRHAGDSDPLRVVLPFSVDARIAAKIRRLPDEIGGSMPDLPGRGAPRRDLSLDMPMGSMMGRRRSALAINGRPFDMNHLSFTIPRGQVQRWRVSGSMMMHPFHVHGAAFQVVSENGGRVGAHNRGWKDTVLVDGQIELLIRFTHPAGSSSPYMLHCHTLEHEDAGMMAQFAVV